MADTDAGGATPADPPGDGGTEGGGTPPTTTDALAGFKAQLATLLGGDEAKASAVITTAQAAGLTSPDDLPYIDAAAWTGFGVPAIKAGRLVSDLKRAATPAAEAVRPRFGGGAATSSLAALPTVPDDNDFLTMLQVGGVLKPEPTDVMAAIRALFAQQIEATDLDDRLLTAIEQRALDNDEQVPQVYYDLEKARARKAHAEVLKALGAPGNLVTERRKKELLGRLGGLWDVLQAFNAQAEAWRDNWTKQSANPGAIIAMMSGAMMPGILEAPDTGPVIDAATGVIDRLNRMFAGTGVPVARALAADAIQLKQLVERTELVAAVGAASREEMLRKLGIGVSADVVRTERSVCQFALATLNLPKVSPDQLPMYIFALAQLGTTIPFSQLKASGNGVGSGKARVGPGKGGGAEERRPF